MKLTVKERGWPGHLIVAARCRYRRNTLISDGTRHIIVSSVGNFWPTDDRGPDRVDRQRWYQTRVFVGHREGPYIEADVEKEVCLPDNIEQGIYGESADDLPEGVDNIADEIHDNIVLYVKQNFDDLYKKALGEGARPWEWESAFQSVDEAVNSLIDIALEVSDEELLHGAVALGEKMQLLLGKLRAKAEEVDDAQTGRTEEMSEWKKSLRLLREASDLNAKTQEFLGQLRECVKEINSEGMGT